MRVSLIAGLAAVLGMLAAAGPAQAQDAAAGQKVFKIYCNACHAVEPGKTRVGPSLFGVYGSETGEVKGFHFSAANKSAHLTWDDATLDRYLENPRKVIPGTTMTFAGLKDAQKRKDLIAYLKTLK